MKTFILLVALVAAVVALPHGREPEFAMVSDDKGNLRLENIHADAEPENFFDAVTDTTYWLYTQQNRNVPQQLETTNYDSFLDSNFNPANPTRILVHGWSGSAESQVNTLVREAYFEKGNFNVIVVDWALGADTTLLVTARNRVGAVGGALAQLINMLTTVGFDIANLNIIGHNLGAHVAGFAGKNYPGATQVGAIVALDASLSNFDINVPAQRLAVGDAIYVESIHTNTGQQGFDWPLGDSAFYPNFGNRQPGCGIDVAGNCAHARSIELFAESINTDRHFWSRQCSAYKDILVEDCTAIGIDRKMGGEPIETLARGIYWLTTNNASPFATGVL